MISETSTNYKKGKRIFPVSAGGEEEEDVTACRSNHRRIPDEGSRNRFGQRGEVTCHGRYTRGKKQETSCTLQIIVDSQSNQGAAHSSASNPRPDSAHRHRTFEVVAWVWSLIRIVGGFRVQSLGFDLSACVLDTFSTGCVRLKWILDSNLHACA